MIRFRDIVVFCLGALFIELHESSPLNQAREAYSALVTQ